MFNASETRNLGRYQDGISNLWTQTTEYQVMKLSYSLARFLEQVS